MSILYFSFFFCVSVVHNKYACDYGFLSHLLDIIPLVANKKLREK